MKNLQFEATIYYRTNSLENMEHLQKMVASSKGKDLNPMILIDLASEVENRPSLNI